MPRINIEDRFWTDQRFSYLGTLTGKGKHDAIGRIIQVWRKCYEGKTDRLSPEQIDMQAELPGFHEMMLKAQLAKAANGDKLMPIKGAKKATEYLIRQQKRGRIGGRARAKQLQAHAKRTPMPRRSQGTHASTSTSTSRSKENNTCASASDFAKSSTLHDTYTEIYQAYPRKRGKKLGLARCRKIEAKYLGALTQAVNNYARHCELNNTEQKYIMQFSTFMNNWEDWVEFEPFDESRKTTNPNAEYVCID